VYFRGCASLGSPTSGLLRCNRPPRWDQGEAYTESDVTTEGGGFFSRGETATYNYGTSTADLAQLFEAIYQQIEARPKDPDVDKEKIVDEVKRIETEAAKGKEANPTKAERWLGTLANMAPEIWDMVTTSLTKGGANVTISKIIAKRKAEDI
jgi:hypothetical protein